MKISDFYESTLGANLNNSRWSWGAYNPNTNQLFLRVWKDQIYDFNGVKYVTIFSKNWKGKSRGYPERENHVEYLRQGVKGYGVECTPKINRNNRQRNIKSFNSSHLLSLGKLLIKGNYTYARILEDVSVKEVFSRQNANSTLIPDLKSLFNKNIKSTAKERLIMARNGQGLFRAQVLNIWGSRCCVTGLTVLDAIRASHIKPWSKSTDNERLDPFNGLPLIATLDALFDAGLISFNNDGKILISNKLNQRQVNLLKLNGLKLNKKPNNKIIRYLSYHRDNVFNNKKAT